MTGWSGRWRRAGVVAGLALVALAGVPLAACSGGDGSSAATTTTLDPLAGPALDDCGNDLSALTTTVRAVDPATGTVRWARTVPLVDHYLLRGETGNVQLPLQGRTVELELDPTTGETVGYPPAGAHEVLVDVARQTISVDGDVRPDAPVVGGMTLSTGYGAVVDGGQWLTATDASGAVVWQVELSPGDATGSVSRPTVFGGLVVVTWSQAAPACGPQG